MSDDINAELLAAVRKLTDRVEGLEAEIKSIKLLNAQNVPEEVVVAISAAVAAYLGHRAKVKQVRLRHNQAWTDAGRFDIQHSHRIQRSR